MLFIEHWFCVLNAINKIKAIKYMVDGVDCYAIVLLTDYKMKYKPRTLSWKNFQKLWRERKYLVVIRTLGYMKTPDGELKDIYLNHIFTDNPKQDWISIVSNFWKNENIRKSRRCMYNLTTQNTTKMVLRFYICNIFLALNGLYLELYLHTETQYGKGLIDAHFYSPMWLLLQFLNRGNNVTSTKELFNALTK